MAGSLELSQQIEEVFLARLREKSELLFVKMRILVPAIIGMMYEFNSINKVAKEGEFSDVFLGASLALGDLTVVVQNMLGQAEIISNMAISEKDYS